MNSLLSFPELPAHAAVLATAEVWLDGAAVGQLDRVARTPGCVAAAGMPDLHCGRGIPVGAAFAFDGRVWPDLVGSDAGCGAWLGVFPRLKKRGDALVRRLERELEEPPLDGLDLAAAFHAVWSWGPAGLRRVPDVPESLLELLPALPDDSLAGEAAPEHLADLAVLHGQALGTIGGGNHFAEVSRIIEAMEPHVGVGSAAVLVHSGSRSVGHSVAERWRGAVLEGSDIDGYLGELEGALRFAVTNRLVIAWRLLRAAGVRADALTKRLDLAHNTVAREKLPGLVGEPWVHRKGCAPAHAGDLTLVLGSRGAPTWLMRGTGCERSLCSVAHGAGRRLSRSDARAKLSTRYGKRPSNKANRKNKQRCVGGSRVLCDNPQLLLEEHPDAYKPIEPVVAALEAAGAATRVAALMPEVTVKC